MSLTKRIAAQALVASISVGWSASAWAQENDAPSVEDIELEAAYPKRSHLTMKIVTGAAIERIADVDFYGAYGEFALGADTRGGGFFAVLAPGGGQTEGGLQYQEFLLGVDAEWPLDFVRLGLRPRIGWLGIERVTESSKIEALRGGIGVMLGVDLIGGDGWVFGLDLEPRIDAAVTPLDIFDEYPTYTAFGVRGGLSLRWRAPRFWSNKP